MKSKITIKDVAKESGFSIATVSYVINDSKKIPEDTRNKIFESINKLGYEPNLNARNLVKNESRLIGIIASMQVDNKRSIFTENPFFQEFFSGVEYKAQQIGYNTLILATKDEVSAIRMLKNNYLAGVIALGEIDEKIYELLEKINAPVVLIDNMVSSNKFCYINSKDEEGAYIATTHLIEAGHREIAFITGGLDHSIIYTERFLGYKRALKEHNISFKSEYIFQNKLSYEGGIEAAKALMKNIPTITSGFCISDIMALGIIKGLYKEGLYVPKNFSLVGFDDIKSSEYFIPGLTTIKQDVFHKAEMAVEIIINNISKDKKINKYVEQVSLVKRESVKIIK